MILATPKSKKWLYVYTMIISSFIPLETVYDYLRIMEEYGDDSVNFGAHLIMSIFIGIISFLFCSFIIKFGIKDYSPSKNIFAVGKLNARNIVVTLLTLAALMITVLSTILLLRNELVLIYHVIFNIVFIFFVLILRAGSDIHR